MAAALHTSAPADHARTLLTDPAPMSLVAPNGHSLFPQALGLSELDLRDHRYPTLVNAADSVTRRPHHKTYDSLDEMSRRDLSSRGGESSWAASEQRRREEASYNTYDHGWELRPSSSPANNHKDSSASSYDLPPGASRRVLDQYTGMDDCNNADGAADTRPPAPQDPQDPSKHRPTPSWNDSSSPRHPQAGVGAGPSSSTNYSPIVPMSASPNYVPSTPRDIPVTQKPRAQAQQPTYITPSAAPNPVNPILSPNPPPPQEEVCVECAMRDQDMADVDVTSPGVWDRESDVYYLELVRREEEEEAAGLPVLEDPGRPRAKGGRLTEANLKLWCSINPKEPSARQQTVAQYVKSQRTLLEAETLARAQAEQESRQLENMMRDTYSQLRQSAYELGSTAVPDDETGGIRIKTPRSTSMPSGMTPAQAREVTLLENGMIVEHVDVKREEREERERRRREERRDRSRARKLSKGSAMDVASINSGPSPTPLTDSGMYAPSLRPGARQSPSTMTRPSSMLTLDRPMIPRAYSQASFSDAQSLGSASPTRRSRFFGLGNLSPGWRSQNSLAASGMSGSMVDMHVALQREQYNLHMAHPSIDISSNAPSLRMSQMWPSDMEAEHIERSGEKTDTVKSKKKRKGLAKIWRIVTGAPAKSDCHINHGKQQSMEKHEEDFPLAPPPPLSYLVDRRSSDHNMSPLRQSMPSLSSTASPSYPMSSPAMSPQTAPSSLLPSPASSRKSNPEKESADEMMQGINNGDFDPKQSTLTVGDDRTRMPSSRTLHSFTSDPDMRGRTFQGSFSSPSNLSIPQLTARPASVIQRDKSLPPLPDDADGRSPADVRPQTVFTYQPPIMPGDFAPPQAAFRTPEVRRQSFGGISSHPRVGPLGAPGRPAAYPNGHLSMVGEPVAARYNEFGHSHRSLGRLDDMRYGSPPLPRMRSQTPSKRKGRFTLSSLFGKKSHGHGHEAKEHESSNFHDYYGGWQSDSDGRHEMGSGHSTAPRMSVMSRKNLEELVEQDPQFVAYRYPSNDQRLDLLR